MCARPSSSHSTSAVQYVVRHKHGLGPDRLLPAASPVAVDLDGVVSLRMDEEGLGARQPVSCYTTIKNSVEKHHSKLAWVDQDRKWTYEQYFGQVTNSAKALIELGLEPNRTVAVLGNNSPEWFSCAVGAVFAGGIVTGVYTTNTAEAVAYQLRHSRANIAVVDSEHQLDKLMSVKDKLPDLKQVILYGEDQSYEDNVINWDDFLALGSSLQEEELKERLEGQSINQPAVICYTSGTTANPKGALLSQDNITWTCASAVETYNFVEGEEVMISYLPVSHIVAQVSSAPYNCHVMIYESTVASKQTFQQNNHQHLL